MPAFTVLLLYPDYMAETFGQETYLAHVDAADPEAAVVLAQMEVDADNNNSADDLNDYFPLAVFAGHLDDLNPRTGGIAAKKG